MGVSGLMGGFCKGLAGIGDGVIYHCCFTLIALGYPAINEHISLQARVAAITATSFITNFSVLFFEREGAKRYWPVGIAFGCGMLTSVLGAWLLQNLDTYVINICLGVLFLFFAAFSATNDIRKNVIWAVYASIPDEQMAELEKAQSLAPEPLKKNMSTRVPSADLTEPSAGNPPIPAEPSDPNYPKMSRRLMLDAIWGGAMTGVSMGLTGVGATALIFFSIRQWPPPLVKASFCVACCMELCIRNMTYGINGTHRGEYWPLYVLLAVTLALGLLVGQALYRFVRTVWVIRFLLFVLWLSGLELCGLYDAEILGLTMLLLSVVWGAAMGLWICSANKRVEAAKQKLLEGWEGGEQTTPNIGKKTPLALPVDKRLSIGTTRSMETPSLDRSPPMRPTALMTAKEAMPQELRYISPAMTHSLEPTPMPTVQEEEVWVEVDLQHPQPPTKLARQPPSPTHQAPLVRVRTFSQALRRSLSSLGQIEEVAGKGRAPGTLDVVDFLNTTKPPAQVVRMRSMPIYSQHTRLSLSLSRALTSQSHQGHGRGEERDTNAPTGASVFRRFRSVSATMLGMGVGVGGKGEGQTTQTQTQTQAAVKRMDGV
ncbi:unnamed protein product [Vitrella brassicaformis CCMP3155]|uniref:Uncharacterized protein n=1 Tax=Vitrella brassicaformis (strain CCMP3155) TaxID=1169540 RepID=A0A0G4GXW5_VITBC|nr:unnamed protein product [Vitrella brassicaformis CCMP3155]|eukprot:CEM35947.1 unnamed protein product [Vitrella brassicaformis CCMP3155]